MFVSKRPTLTSTNESAAFWKKFDLSSLMKLCLEDSDLRRGRFINNCSYFLGVLKKAVFRRKCSLSLLYQGLRILMRTPRSLMHEIVDVLKRGPTTVVQSMILLTVSLGVDELLSADNPGCLSFACFLILNAVLLEPGWLLKVYAS